ncbi:MAG TPA: DUF4337 domain-containing protein [Polyangiaceae bacterium]|jgi:hypothetical protein
MEEAIETQELKEKLEEAQEHHHGHGSPLPWLTYLSLSTAIIAVLAAIAALESGSYANDAIVEKNDAVLHQSKADDAWAHYQAKGVEAVVFSTQAEQATRPDLAAHWRSEGDREKAERAEVRQDAEKEEQEVAHMNEKSEHSLHVHHTFAQSVTIFQVAIALSAIGALTRRKPMWWVSLAMGAIGAGLFAFGLTLH